MLEPEARDSAMVPSFHVRSGADRCAVMRLAAVGLNAAAAGDCTPRVLPARDPATTRIVFMKMSTERWCHWVHAQQGSAPRLWAPTESFPNDFRGIGRKPTLGR
jgi:hypothetical protein